MTDHHFFHGGILSQWAPTRFEFEGVVYTRCEQWMMAMKARLFADADSYAMIMVIDDPRTHKAIGRTVRGFDEAVWKQHRQQIVYAGNLFRARQDTAFRTALLATDDKVLVEASPHDRIWGIGFNAANALANRPRWGLNLLGETLDLVRATVRRGA